MKKIIPVFLVLLLLLGTFSVGVSAAEVKLFPISLVDSKAVVKSGAENLFDGSTSTRWEVLWNRSLDEYGEVSVTVKTDVPIILTQYTFVMSNDASKYPGAYPGAWTLYGGNSADECNTVLGKFTVDRNYFKSSCFNNRGFDYTVTGDCKTSFSYFKFVFEDVVDIATSTSAYYSGSLKLGGICDFKGYDEEHEHQYKDGICAICGAACEHTGDVYTVCAICGETVTASKTASVLSSGRSEIVFGIGGFAVGFVAAMLIFRKKKGNPTPDKDAAKEDEA